MMILQHHSGSLNSEKLCPKFSNSEIRPNRVPFDFSLYVRKKLYLTFQDYTAYVFK